jgi:hypothetical protein
MLRTHQSRDILTLTEVYEALQQREKMKSMVQDKSLSSKAEALEVQGRPEQRDNYHHHNNRDKSKTDQVAQSPRDMTSSAGIVRNPTTILMIIGSCRTRRKEMELTNRKTMRVMVRLP